MPASEQQPILEPDRNGVSSAALPDLPRIRAYYDETWLDYRFLWLSPRNLAVHFGYWDEYTRSHAESLVNMNRLLASRIGIHEEERVLDAGCGVGGSSLWLAKTFAVSVMGITPVASQIARARYFARREGLSNRVRFAQEDYTRTSFPDASFDVIWAVESVCHAPDKRLFLREARRLLRPGGRLGIVEYMRFDRPYAEADEALLASWLSGWAIPDIATRDEWQTLDVAMPASPMSPSRISPRGSSRRCGGCIA